MSFVQHIHKMINYGGSLLIRAIVSTDRDGQSPPTCAGPAALYKA
jgi:hypothetical protein